MKEYKKCNTTGKTCHYTEFDKASWGWYAIDGSRRHSQSKEGKRINSSLFNGLRVTRGGKLISIASEEHPYHEKYRETVEEVRKENPEYKNHLLRADLTKEVYVRMYETMGRDLPDVERARNKKYGRSSMPSELCMDWFGVPKDARELRLGRYYPDAVVGQTIYEFFGDFFHANPEIYNPDSKIFNYTAEEKWQKDQKRIEFFKEMGYTVKVIWEKDWKDFQSNCLTKEEFLQKVLTR